MYNSTLIFSLPNFSTISDLLEIFLKKNYIILFFYYCIFWEVVEKYIHKLLVNIWRKLWIFFQTVSFMVLFFVIFVKFTKKRDVLIVEDFELLQYMLHNVRDFA
jgi:hypothetical protein